MTQPWQEILIAPYELENWILFLERKNTSGSWVSVGDSRITLGGLNPRLDLIRTVQSATEDLCRLAFTKNKQTKNKWPKQTSNFTQVFKQKLDEMIRSSALKLEAEYKTVLFSGPTDVNSPDFTDLFEAVKTSMELHDIPGILHKPGPNDTWEDFDFSKDYSAHEMLRIKSEAHQTFMPLSPKTARILMLSTEGLS